MLSESQIEQFWKNGFLKGGSVMSESEADELRMRLFEVIEGRSKGKPELLRDVSQEGMKSLTQIVNIWEADELFNNHRESGTIKFSISRRKPVGRRSGIKIIRYGQL